MSVTQEEIAAFADGELSGDDLARVESAVETDPDLAAKVETHRALKAKLGAHFAPVLEQPVPDHLAAMLKPKAHETGGAAEVVSFAKERQKRGLVPFLRSSWGPIAGGSIAAALVLAIFQPWQTSAVPEGYAGQRLASALTTQLVADQSADQATQILLSFESENGELCRAYRDGGSGGIACRDETGWQLEQQFALDDAQTTEFRQAGSEADLLAAAQEMAKGDALDEEAEAAAKENGWR